MSESVVLTSNILRLKRTMYHTQEDRGVRLSSPIICIREDAWLGEGYYFWDDIDDAKYWGIKSKVSTGRYDIYESIFESTNMLDTVFNEEHYVFWINQIEMAAESLARISSEKPTLKELNEYFKNIGGWDEVTGILFQDMPANEQRSKISRFFYKKRIQAVVFDEAIILTFAHCLNEPC